MLGITTVLGGVLILLAGLNYRLKAPSPSGSKSVGLIVLGDIGRSPRMLYHAQSFLQNGYTTYIVAYRGEGLLSLSLSPQFIDPSNLSPLSFVGSNPPRSLTENEKCHFVYLSQPLAFSSKLPKIGFLFIAPFKVLFGALYLLSALLFIIPQSPTFFFVQASHCSSRVVGERVEAHHSDSTTLLAESTFDSNSTNRTTRSMVEK